MTRNISIFAVLLIIFIGTGIYFYNQNNQAKTTNASVQGVREENKSNSNTENKVEEKEDKENNPGTV
jgi:uncharacterized protein HemX